MKEGKRKGNVRKTSEMRCYVQKKIITIIETFPIVSDE